MKKNAIFLTVLVCLLSATMIAQRTRTGSSRTSQSGKTGVETGQNLPIKRVIVYSNGVAYIERRGIVNGNVEVNLAFKQSQVDDVLKSMVVLDLGKGRIGTVSYNSSAPQSARMAEIPFSVRAKTNGDTSHGGIAGVLSQLQGARVLVTSSKGAASGAILTVEKRMVTDERMSRPNHYLVISSETGEISNFNLTDVRSVKLLDGDTKRDVNEFAKASASTRRRDAKTITVTSEGSSRRELVVSYTISAPIWKTTYRVVLDDEGKPFFQGWAIVDNVSEDDWKDIQLSLVSGSPVSFIQNLQRPFYRYRPVVPTPKDLQLSPQIYETGTSRSGPKKAISGTVTDTTGAVIPNAAVTITNSSSGERYSLNTDGQGFFLQS
ncbi:MAG: carboxypeptidase regulatory-like domain-containing protein, partial [Pyrinomonadaceae bacterium]|nr:carboxypeptidase regulatory-like domain-containing protein [Pyrinomonadaceae bacterium]